MSRALGPTKRKRIKKIEVDIRQTEMNTGIQASAGGTDDEDGEWTAAGVPGS